MTDQTANGITKPLNEVSPAQMGSWRGVPVCAGEEQALHDLEEVLHMEILANVPWDPKWTSPFFVSSETAKHCCTIEKGHVVGLALSDLSQIALLPDNMDELQWEPITLRQIGRAHV